MLSNRMTNFYGVNKSRGNYTNFKAYKIAIIVIFGCICSCIQANIKQVDIKSSITPDHVNLSAKTFLTNFISQDEDTRKTAQLYLLGVMDATEGRSWCDYRQFSTATLNEFIFEYFKKRTQIELEQRASTLIENSLQSYFPCKKK